MILASSVNFFLNAERAQILKSPLLIYVYGIYYPYLYSLSQEHFNYVIDVGAAMMWPMLTGDGWVHTFMTWLEGIIGAETICITQAALYVCAIPTEGGSCCVMYKQLKIAAV